MELKEIVLKKIGRQCLRTCKFNKLNPLFDQKEDISDRRKGHIQLFSSMVMHSRTIINTFQNQSLKKLHVLDSPIRPYVSEVNSDKKKVSLTRNGIAIGHSSASCIRSEGDLNPGIGRIKFRVILAIYYLQAVNSSLVPFQIRSRF